jgi:hypothetical protein
VTLREFVEHGHVGTRAERERFETGLVEGWQRAIEAGIPMKLDADPPHETWAICFNFAKGMLTQWGAWQ